MLTQTDLLERARAGNPQAIADLMNLVLEPKGATVKAVVNDTCLHLFFTSKHVLSQTSLVNFVRTGLTNLHTEAIQNVKLQAYLIGQPAPQWVTELWLHEDPARSRPPSVKTNASNLNTQLIGSSTTKPIGHPIAETSKRLKVPSKGNRKLSKGVKRSKSRPGRDRAYPPLHSIIHLVWGRFPPRTRLFMASTIGIGAFLIGGVVATVINLQAENQSQSGTIGAVAVPHSSNQAMQPIKQASSHPSETEAKQYLTKMNRAQKAFYEANRRFATTLEELERSASVISQSAHYSYRLVIRSAAQAVLTATPKEEGLRSFTGTVVLKPTDQGSTAIATILCESHALSQFPPVIPQVRSGVLQCPADSNAIPDQ